MGMTGNVYITATEKASGIARTLGIYHQGIYVV
jgi:hypothetical protein